MAQSDVIKVLEKHKDKWLSVREIAKIARVPPSSIREGAKRMAKFGELEVIECKSENHWIYKYKLKGEENV